MHHTARARLERGARQVADAPPAAAETGERHLVLALLLRAILDACASPQARAWLETEAFTDWCHLIDLPAARLRAAVAADPMAVRRWGRTLAASGTH